MRPTKKSTRGKPKRKTRKKAQPAKKAKPQSAQKKPETRKAEDPVSIQPISRVEPPSQASVRLTVENIRGETAIGDLLVAFPRTREILVRNGLRLEAEDAGDIYMTLDAFSALNGLKAQTLVQDLISVAKEPPPQHIVPQLAAPATV
jgi:hypothetical protein